MHFVGFFGEINLISVIIIILNRFFVILNRFEHDIETYYFDSLLELSKKRPLPPPKSPKIKPKIEF